MNNIGAFKKKWIENPSDEKGVLLYLPVSEVFISAKFGTGENLLKEDITRAFHNISLHRCRCFFRQIEATTSMQRDVMEGKQSEIDGLVYEVVRIAKKYGVEVPVYERAAEKFREMEVK